MLDGNKTEWEKILDENPQEVLREIKSNPKILKELKNIIAENDIHFKNIKTVIYKDLETHKTPQEKYNYLKKSVIQITDMQIKYDAKINEKWTVEQKLNSINNGQVVYEAMISFCEKLMYRYKELIEPELSSLQNTVETKTEKKEFTTARQVLAIHYLLQELKVSSNTVDKTEIARFIQFLTGKETGVSKIKDTSIYKKVKSLLSKNDRQLELDLQFIRIYFEKLGLNDITDKINKEIRSKE